MAGLWRADLSLNRVLNHAGKCFDAYEAVRQKILLTSALLQCSVTSGLANREGRLRLSQNNITTDNTKNHNASTVKHCSACFQHRLSQSNITTNLTTVEPGGSKTSRFTLQHYSGHGHRRPGSNAQHRRLTTQHYNGCKNKKGGGHCSPLRSCTPT